MEISQKDLTAFFISSGIHVPKEELNIGRQLTYANDPERTVVIQFIESDFPDVLRMTLEALILLEHAWILIERFGKPVGIKYSDHECYILINKLIDVQPNLRHIGDDLILVSEDGKAILSFDHHMDEGMPLFFSDVDKAGLFIAKLNQIGAEFEVYSKHG